MAVVPQITPEIQQSVSAYLAKHPDQQQAFERDYNGDIGAWLNAFTAWWDQNGNSVGDLANYQDELGLLGNLGFDTKAGAQLNANGVPIEQGILQTALPGIVSNIQGDAARQADVTRLSDQTTAGYDNLRSVLNQANSTFDGNAYIQQNPGVGQLFGTLNNGATPGTKSVPTPNGPQDMTASQFAEFHYNNFGKNEGLAPAYSSDLLRNQNRVADQTTAAQSAAAQTSAQAQLAALQQSITQMSGNLQGALGEQASALAKNVETLNANLGTLDASQKQNLAAQIQSQQADLEQQVAAQRQTLEQQVNDLQGNATSAAASRRTALEQQIAQLTAAQAPLSEARIKGAEALVTAINVGLEGTRDQLRADAARDGLTGGSTMQDAALARATIGARQNAAQELAGARISNATDTRAIGQYGANTGYSIADAYAGDTKGISDYGATGRAELGNNLATGTRTIGDFSATQGRSLADTTAASRAGIGAYGANTTLSNANAGINANLALENSGATGVYSLATSLAQQQQDAANRNAAAKAGYSDQLFSNSLNAAQINAGLPGAEAASKAALIPYGSAGTRDSLSLLNWWATPNNPTGTTATIVQPDQSGNAISNLGAGLVGSAFKVGAANNWWQNPSTTTTTKTGINNTATTNAGKPGYDAYGYPTD